RAVDVVAEGGQMVPGPRDLAEAPEREAPAVDERRVGLRRGEDQPDQGGEEEDGERREYQGTGPPCPLPHQSSVRNRPVRVTTTTAANSPITRRSTEM